MPDQNPHGTPRPAQFKTWTPRRKLNEAMRLVLDEGWSQSEAARHLGVHRQQINAMVAARRKAGLPAPAPGLNRGLPAPEPLALVISDADPASSQPGLSPFGLNETRRTGTFEEFDERYWGSWVCPDCSVGVTGGIHHELPDFHRDVIDVLEEDNPRVLINLPPYHAKSTLVTVKHTIYQIAKDPNHRTIIISKSDAFAKTFLHSIAQLLTNPDLYPGNSIIEDFGPFQSDSSAWNQSNVYVAGRVTAEKDPTVQVIGVGAQIYGRRADTIKADDCATLENQRNPKRVLDMLEWFDKEVASRIGRRGKLIWVGTRVHPGDIYSTLGNRPGYKVLRYPLITDDTNGEVLWPDHFTYDMALARRSEMKDADFQLVYQNIDIPGLGASFSSEIIDPCKDKSRAIGMYESQWYLVAGLDLAGGTAGSGYTAGVLLAVDLRTGKRFLVDTFNEKSMKAPQLKAKIFEWQARYPIRQWRVENNGIQSQLVQYNDEIIKVLASYGVKVVPHNTQNNKWDAEFGVESLAPLLVAEMISLPWANAITARQIQQLIDQLIPFPMGIVTDLVMAFWFAELGCRDVLRRAQMPLFDARMKVPERIKRGRRVVDFGNRRVMTPRQYTEVPETSGIGPNGYRRTAIGRPVPSGTVPDEMQPAMARQYVNVAGDVPDDDL